MAVTLPLGFQAAGLAAGIKPSGKPDLALFYSPFPLQWAFAGTENLVKAPCVTRNRSRYSSGQPVRALVVNSGNANCATGDQGIWDNEDFAGITAQALGLVKVQDVLTASTGVVGRRLPMDRIRAAAPALVEALQDQVDPAAEAIMTTDSCSKIVAATVRGGAKIVGVAKGSGMIHPNMATMLAFILTDAVVAQSTLRGLWGAIVERTFNQVTVDGDTSPNDMALVLSSNQVACDERDLAQALEGVAERLAQKIARDGEGATKLITVEVHGARSSREARIAARAVARSSLVKAAAHGNDPNWGRILVAIGAAGIVCDLASLAISVQGVTVYRGEPLPFDAADLSRQMNAEELRITVNLAAGTASGVAWGCDLSAEYVRINADYTT